MFYTTMGIIKEENNYPKQDLYECEKCGEYKFAEDFEGSDTCFDCSAPEPKENIWLEDKIHSYKQDEQDAKLDAEQADREAEQRYLERESFNVDEGDE